MPGKLEQELKVAGGFQTLEQEALLNITRTNDQLAIHFVRLFREHGITPAQYNILRVLRGAKQPLPVLEVAERLITVVPGITGLVDRLEKLEMVRRKRCEVDRRVVYVEILEQGVAVLAKLEQPVRELHQSLLGHLSEPELRRLVALLEKVRAHPGAPG
jgi:DNA-binding MarR family transcriptional regulator